MSLSASMWTAVSGLLVHGEKMSVVGNNIANVNTLGFKGSRMDFQDFVNQNVYAANGVSQVGRGVAIGAIFGDFSQGSFETTTNSMDMAIHGNGFFKVKPVGQDTEYYTRAGNFRFNAEGYLVDPHGYAVQGWGIQNATPSLGSTASAGSSSASSLKGSGSPMDIKLGSFSCEPKHTNNVTLELNLSSEASSETTHTVDPFFALLHQWDADNPPALGENAYSYQHTMYVYDEGGAKHKLTVYFDKVDQSEMDPAANVPTNVSYWEFIVTMDPAEDNRDFTVGGLPDDKLKGVLMAGTLEFDSTGEFKNMSAYVPTEGGSNMTNLGTWKSAPISSNGYPLLAPNFSGAPDASNPWDATYSGLNPNAQNNLIEFNLGLRNKSGSWATTTIPPAAASQVGDDPANINAMVPADIQPQAGRTKSYASASGAVNQYQDGYSFGYLADVYVDRDGILYGKYSNGQELALYQIALYDFTSPHNLYREGGNLFSATNASGDPSSGPANSMGMGSVYGNSLEQSNVDLATEFVNMITTQRGFQANSKAITTVDTMLETVISMKR